MRVRGCVILWLWRCLFPLGIETAARDSAELKHRWRQVCAKASVSSVQLVDC